MISRQARLARGLLWKRILIMSAKRLAYQCALILTLGLVRAGFAQAPVGSGFAYQGQIKQDGLPLNGSVDLEFSLHPAPDAADQIGTDFRINGVEVTTGLFNVQVDFGAEAFSGSTRWLEVRVRAPHDPTDVAPFITLDPRHEVSPTPYATHAQSATIAQSAQRPFREEGVDAVFEGGNVGVNTILPLARVHVVDGPLGVSTDAIRDDDLIVEDSDAVLGLYSSDSGSTGSVFSLKEIVGGAVTDNWSIWRGSTNGDSALHFSYGFDPASTINPDMMTIAPTGKVGIGVTSPDAQLHVGGDLGLRVDDALGSPVLSVNRNGNNRVGVGTDAPRAALSVLSDQALIEGPVTQSDDIVVESTNAVLGLYSDGSGITGSAISLKEIHPQGPLTDHWAMYRETNQSGAALRFTYGSNVDYGLNQLRAAFTLGAGNNAVVLPASSIGSGEIADEMGVARHSSDEITGIPEQSTVELASRFIDCPAAGFVLAIGEAGFTRQDSGFLASVRLAIERHETGDQREVSERVPGSGHAHVSLTALFDVTPGNHSFDLSATNPFVGPQVNASDVSLTLVFIPTAYGVADVEQAP